MSPRRTLSALLAGLSLLAVASWAGAASFTPAPLFVSPQAALDREGQKRTAPQENESAATLSGARGETLALQVVVLLEPGERLESLRVETEFPVPMPSRAHWAFRIWGTPEVAVPIGPSGVDLPPRDILNHQDAQARVWPLWLEVEIPRSQSPAEVRGAILLRWKGGQVRLPLRVEVYDFDLPLRPSFVLEMNSYGDFARLLPADAKTVLAFHRLMRRFRCTFTLVPYRQGGELVADFLAPRLTREGGGARLDWREFDQALGGLFDGRAFDDGQPVSHFLLPLATSWPDIASFNPEEQVAVRRAIDEHIREQGWKVTRFQEFHNENPEHGSKAPWRLDEPVSARDWSGHEMFAGWLERAQDHGPGGNRVRYRIDCSLRSAHVDYYRNMFRHRPDWSLSGDRVNAEWTAFFRQTGEHGLVFAYGELPGFQVYGRSTPMAALPAKLATYFSMGLDGFAQWQADCWRRPPGDTDRLAPEDGPLVYSNAAGARDFVWPGTHFGLQGPIPSLRLFALREGQNLIDYATLAARRHPGQAQAIRAELGRLNPTDPAQIPRLKRKLAGILAPAAKEIP